MMIAEPPLATSRAGAPILHGALGATFHLEALVPEDGERLERACGLLLAWFGASLRWTWSSQHAAVVPFAADALELVSAYPGQLVDDESHPDPRGQRGASALAAARYDRFGVACHGGADRNDASPFTLRFYATAGLPGDDRVFRTRAMLGFTVPQTCDLAEFQARVLGVAALLRLRWGAAGLTYGAWEHDRYGETRDAIYAHARRYPGYDHGQHATLMEAWHDRLRTVSWLTFLGPALAEHAQRGGAIVGDAVVGVGSAGEALVLRAGARPEAGDANWRHLPDAYARVDRLLRSVRASGGLHFLAPWSERTTEDWLARFEGAPR